MTASLRIRVSIAAGMALSLSACATSPQADAYFGQSVRAALASQVAQPAAVRNPDPVAGMDGRAARAAQEQYERSFGPAQGGAATAPSIVAK